MEDYTVVKSDFNEIAELGDDPAWNHNNCYFRQLLKYVPEQTGICLDIGCGKGELSLLLAGRAEKVVAVDIADKMIEYARSRNAADNIEYRCENVLDMSIEDNSISVIITTATAHHLPFEWLLDFARKKLKTGGRLIILDLAKAGSLADNLIWGAAFLPNIIMNLIKNKKLRKDDPHAAEVWRKHGGHDTYMTIREIRRHAAKHLPEAVIRRKLFWRYTLIWEAKDFPQVEY
ncbi:MAG: class I SAM-dependent methyltransferase [Clostridiales bacterium]|nr:class I SAM-dependent methyltransferase [Clostridiales bacterium]